MIKCQYEEDLWLLRGVASSDDTAINEIYRTMLPPITQYLQGKGAARNTTEDLFQEALVVLYKRLRQGDFTLTCKLRSYLQSIVRNLWLKQTRDNKTSATSFPDNDIVDVDENTQLFLENQERESVFWEYFLKLPDTCQQILQMFFQGNSMKSIAQDLESTEGYIKKRKHHCKQKLVDTIQSDNRYNELKWDQ